METQGDKAGTKAQGTTMNWQTMKETQIHKGGQAEETQVNHVKIITKAGKELWQEALEQKNTWNMRREL